MNLLLALALTMIGVVMVMGSRPLEQAPRVALFGIACILGSAAIVFIRLILACFGIGD